MNIEERFQRNLEASFLGTAICTSDAELIRNGLYTTIFCNHEKLYDLE